MGESMRLEGTVSAVLEVLRTADMFAGWGFDADHALNLAILALNVRLQPESYR